MILPTSVSSAIWEERAIKWRHASGPSGDGYRPTQHPRIFSNDTLLWVRPGPETVSHSWPAIAAQMAPMSTSFSADGNKMADPGCLLGLGRFPNEPVQRDAKSSFWYL